MKETPMRRIMVTSSLYEISTKQLGNWFLLCLPPTLTTVQAEPVNLLRSPGFDSQPAGIDF
jgi:hypothetical protein